ncbi:hypothetical protein AB1Y20_017565 [Prymnesium parvum]|uniref:H(+)-exporting diphosphatase n=1 Tax=Prymnesium parvum TaxID=97485 RepID=A0AB34JNT4_PRYPA
MACNAQLLYFSTNVSSLAIQETLAGTGLNPSAYIVSYFSCASELEPVDEWIDRGTAIVVATFIYLAFSGAVLGAFWGASAIAKATNHH